MSKFTTVLQRLTEREMSKMDKINLADVVERIEQYLKNVTDSTIKDALEEFSELIEKYKFSAEEIKNAMTKDKSSKSPFAGNHN